MIRSCRAIVFLAIALLSNLGSQVAAASRQVAPAPDAICPILIGSSLPQITLQALDGSSFDLNRAVTGKPTVLIYFRGGW